MKLKPKAKWVEFSKPAYPGKWYRWGDTAAYVTLDDGLWHMSISCPGRYPTWDEISAAWYELVPGAGREFTGGILLPRKAEYVNLHPNCFHVHQLLDAEVPAEL